MGWGKEIRIISLLTLDTVFFLLEVIIGYMSHSLALIADSFHMLNDIIALLVALWAVDVAKNRNPDSKYTYGWKRAEILGALINAVFLIALCFSILVEALQRLISPQEIDNPKRVMYVGCAGLVSNIVGMFLFHEHGGGEGGFAHGHSHGGDIESGPEHGHGHSHGHSHSHEHSHDNTHDHGDTHEHKHGHTHRRLSGLGLDDADDNCEVCRATIGDILPDHVVHKLATECDSLLGNTNESAVDFGSGGKGSEAVLVDKKKKHSSRSLNMHGVFLHVLGDALGNVGVIASALFIWKTKYTWRFYFDPAVSILITMIIFSSAIPLSRRASKILLQATPSSISTDELEREILQIPGVVTVHDFHVWNLTESIFIASIHVQISGSPDQYVSIAKQIRAIFHMYGIHSATVQPEFVSGEVSKEMLRRFSRIAGNIRHSSSPSSSLRCETPDNYATERENSNDSDIKQGNNIVHTSPVSYGSTGTAGRCLIDDAVHCNTDECLGKRS